MARNSQRGSKNNNPEGRNQYSYDRPLATAVTAAAAVGAGVFLWSRRNQISEQLASLSDQINEWREGYGSDSEAGTEDSFIASRRRSSGKSQAEIAEEALTLKETGAKAQASGEPVASGRTTAGSTAL